MTTADKELDRLDRFLNLYGSGAGTLQRISGSPPAVTATISNVPAHVRKYVATELTPSIIQGDSQVIISATSITTSDWPGDTTSEGFIHRGDKWLWNDGKIANVEFVEHVRLQGVLVRIVMQVRG